MIVPTLQQAAPLLRAVAEVLTVILRAVAGIVNEIARRWAAWPVCWGSTPRGRRSAAVTINNQFDLPTINPDKTSTQVATKLLPHIKKVHQQLHHDLHGTAATAKIGRAIGGRHH